MKTPEQIEKVAAAWRANAEEAGMPEDSCYVSFDPEEERRVKEYYTDQWGSPDYRYKEVSGPAWEVTCNYEQGPILFWFPEQDIWLLMYQYAGGCSIMKGGFREALETAGMIYTG
tara:strand:+ start:1030 stop:1374 length:345 start_codon:yes stop_codon:yes gene_type:complete